MCRKEHGREAWFTSRRSMLRHVREMHGFPSYASWARGAGRREAPELQHHKGEIELGMDDAQAKEGRQRQMLGLDPTYLRLEGKRGRPSKGTQPTVVRMEPKPEPYKHEANFEAWQAAGKPKLRDWGCPCSRCEKKRAAGRAKQARGQITPIPSSAPGAQAPAAIAHATPRPAAWSSE